MPFPEIEKSELEAVRQFLISDRDEVRKARSPRILQDSKSVVTLRHGIARAGCVPAPRPRADTPHASRRGVLCRTGSTRPAREGGQDACESTWSDPSSPSWALEPLARCPRDSLAKTRILEELLCGRCFPRGPSSLNRRHQVAKDLVPRRAPDLSPGPDVATQGRPCTATDPITGEGLRVQDVVYFQLGDDTPDIPIAKARGITARFANHPPPRRCRPRVGGIVLLTHHHCSGPHRRSRLGEYDR